MGQEPLTKEFILDLFYTHQGNLDQINQAIDEKLKKIRTRNITLFEKYIQSRLRINPKVLKLVNFEVTPLELVYLSQYPALEQVEVLDLRKNHFGDEGLEPFAQSSLFENLRQLDLRNNLITPQGMDHLLQSPFLKNLEKMDLRLNKLGKRWEEKLKNCGNFPNLKDVHTV